MKIIFYTPIKVQGFGRKNTKMYAANAQTMVYEGDIKIEMNFKGDTDEEALEKAKKFISAINNDDNKMTFELDFERLGVKEFIDSNGKPFFVYNGYYVSKGGIIINECNTATFENGMDLDTLIDDDAFSWHSEILTIEEFVIAVES